MKKLLFSFLLLGFVNIYAQEVKLKDNKVIVDGVEILKYEKINYSHYSFFDKEGTEIIMYKHQNNQTQNYDADNYYTINFLTQKKKVETSDFSLIMAMSSTKNMEKLIKLLLKEKVLDLNGNINAEKLDVFYDKYNQNIK